MKSNNRIEIQKHTQTISYSQFHPSAISIGNNTHARCTRSDECGRKRLSDQVNWLLNKYSAGKSTAADTWEGKRSIAECPQNSYQKTPDIFVQTFTG